MSRPSGAPPATNDPASPSCTTLFCPHTATAVKVLQDLRARGAKGDWAVVATAHPAKFEAVVEPLIDETVAVPPALDALLQRPAHAEPLAADYAALREVLMR